MKMTADQLLKIAGIAPTTTLRTRLNESAGSRTRRSVKEAVGSNEVTISAAAHKQLTAMLTWLDARPKGFPDDIFDDDDEVGTALDNVCNKVTGSDELGSPQPVKGKLMCYSHETDGYVTLVVKSGGSVKESAGGGKLIHLFTSVEDSDFSRSEYNSVDEFFAKSGEDIGEYSDLFYSGDYTILTAIDAEDVANNVIIRGSSDPYDAEQAREFEAAANEINSMVARNRNLVIVGYGFEYDEQYLVLTRDQLAEIKAAAADM